MAEIVWDVMVVKTKYRKRLFWPAPMKYLYGVPEVV
jgi:hypothetical protein